jgi:hypothetical protein
MKYINFIFWGLSLISLFCNDSVQVMDSDFTIYKVVSINGKLIEDLIKMNDNFDIPKQINLRSNRKYEGTVIFERLKEKNITSSNPSGTSFRIDTKGELGPVEFISFSFLTIFQDTLKCSYCCWGPAIDPSCPELIAVKIKKSKDK